MQSAITLPPSTLHLTNSMYNVNIWILVGGGAKTKNKKGHPKRPRLIKHRHKITNVPWLKMGLGLWIQPSKSLNGAISRFQNGLLQKSQLLEGSYTFWPQNVPLLSLVTIKGSKKVSSPSKSLDFVPGPFGNLKMHPWINFLGLIS